MASSVAGTWKYKMVEFFGGFLFRVNIIIPLPKLVWYDQHELMRCGGVPARRRS